MPWSSSTHLLNLIKRAEEEANGRVPRHLSIYHQDSRRLESFPKILFYWSSCNWSLRSGIVSHISVAPSSTSSFSATCMLRFYCFSYSYCFLIIRKYILRNACFYTFSIWSKWCFYGLVGFKSYMVIDCIVDWDTKARMKTTFHGNFWNSSSQSTEWRHFYSNYARYSIICAHGHL